MNNLKGKDKKAAARSSITFYGLKRMLPIGVKVSRTPEGIRRTYDILNKLVKLAGEANDAR